LGGPNGTDHWEDLGTDGDNIKMDLRDIGINGANWIQLAQDTVQWHVFVNTVMNLQVP
jgi:hypothetical protein